MLRTFLFILCSALAAHPTFAQPSAPSTAAAFDAVSIKPSNSESKGGSRGVSRNEYFAKNTPLAFIILEAYLGDTTASPFRLRNAPTWVMTDGYDITAKADDATADSWKGLSQAQQIGIAAPLLRAMLEDRCRLVVHTVPAQSPAYALVLKGHLRLKETQPDEPDPKKPFGRFPGGWTIVYPDPDPDITPTTGFRKITMSELAQFMSKGGPPVIDQTGLTGRYDFDLSQYEIDLPPSMNAAAVPPPRIDAAHLFDWHPIGLNLKPIQVPGVDVVIDHIEQPSAN